ncbi:hypothetical protein B7486_68310 [cyanobacterium TDX16]|nr:hypothetical protein B7486_68310 [cyanobacterium TDX16]
MIRRRGEGDGAEPVAKDDAAQGPEAERGAAAMTGKVIGLRCRGCSKLIATEHAWNKPADIMQVQCDVCATQTTYRPYEVMDPPVGPGDAEDDPGLPDAEVAEG